MINNKSRILKFIFFNLRPDVLIYRIENSYHMLYCKFSGGEYKRLSFISIEKHLLKVYDTSISPEEFAARYGHREMCNSSDEYHYRNKKFQDWINEYLSIMRNPEIHLEDLRLKYMTEKEIAQIKKGENEEF